ncbi:MAG: polysaccharide deacetylase family protein [Chitinophagaceae bacterium]
MHPKTGKGSATPGAFLRPLMLLFFCMACSKITRESKYKLNHEPPVAAAKEAKLPPPKKKKKKIYLTFDDGPNKGTPTVLSIVQQEQVPVTFFIVGEHVFASTTQHATWDSLQQAAMVELCNHSYTHAHNHYDKFYGNADSVVNDFERCRDSLNLDNNIARTPGRNIWRIDTLSYTDLKKSAMAADSLQQAGFTIIGWDLEWHYDHKTFSLKSKSDELLQQIDSLFAHNKTRLPENLVLLAHDQVYKKSDDSAELHRLIKLLKQRDEYELLVASNYPGAGNRMNSQSGQMSQNSQMGQNGQTGQSSQLSPKVQ